MSDLLGLLCVHGADATLCEECCNPPIRGGVYEVVGSPAEGYPCPKDGTKLQMLTSSKGAWCAKCHTVYTELADEPLPEPTHLDWCGWRECGDPAHSDPREFRKPTP